MDNTIDSVLLSIKKLLGITKEYAHFDQDIIMHINSVFLDLSQIGVGPKEGFSITDETTEWTEFISEGIVLNSVKTYVYLKVKLLFDPPNSSSAVDAINRQIDRLEWRINSEVDSGQEKEEEIQSG